MSLENVKQLICIGCFVLFSSLSAMSVDQGRYGSAVFSALVAIYYAFHTFGQKSIYLSIHWVDDLKGDNNDQTQ